MAQAIAETVFDMIYLGFALTTGLIMLLKGKTTLDQKMGCMAALLGAGDAFHLVPRCYALFTTGLEANAAALGFGKFVTSITMTIFYLRSTASNRDADDPKDAGLCLGHMDGVESFSRKCITLSGNPQNSSA